MLVDYARQRRRAKRGGHLAREPLREDAAAMLVDAERIVEIDLALQKLAGVDERLVRVFECRFFGGLTEQETADALGLSLRTAQRDWLKARAWLRAELSGRR